MALLVGAFGPATAYGAGESLDIEPAKRAVGAVSIYLENDIFYNTDQYYTNAFKVRFISPSLNSLADNGISHDFFDGLMDKVEQIGRSKATQYNVSIGFGQSLYTPNDTQVKTLEVDDRPYAAHLYGFLGLHIKEPRLMDTYELSLGMVGPAALGRQTQNTVHRIKGVDTAKGWANQLHNEPAVGLSWTRNYRVLPNGEGPGWNWNILPYHSVTLGNVLTQAAVGTEMRFGYNLPRSFGTSQIKPGSSVNAPSDSPLESGQDPDWNIYFFAGAEGRAVARNIFLDGNTWKSSHSVKKKPFVGELNAGLAVTINGITVSYNHVYLTREFKKQPVKKQEYGSINITIPFDLDL
ncbi:lipid A deacylase LpxR family protein [Deltaproteobacteria bacterium OttesenSCG-928-K17]|nr:lipid A deacylase LpxR family protein [Deltaproteobacteria bacterium OttesenSCG-928-K17]